MPEWLVNNWKRCERKQFLLTVSPYSTVTKLPRKIILALLLSGGGAGVAHYCSIDESRSWPASKKQKKMTDYFKI
jgi:hypothetical protein